MMRSSIVFLLALAAVGAQPSPSSVRLWGTDSLIDGVQDSLLPVISDFICTLPMARLLASDSIQEGPLEIAVNDFKLSSCSVRSFSVHNEQGGIRIKISGLNAGAWGASVVKMADCHFMCSGPMDAMFTADMENSEIDIVVKLDAANGTPVVRVQSISTDIHLSNIQLKEFKGLTPFASLVSGVIEKATNRLTERTLSSTIDKLSAVFGRLPFHLPLGTLFGSVFPRAANLKLDMDVSSIHYVQPAWVIDVLTVLSSPPQVGARSFPHGPTALPSSPPAQHRTQQLIGAASPWTINEVFYTLEKLGVFTASFEADLHGTRVPVTVSTSPSLALRDSRAVLSFNSTFAGPSERTNSTITLGADSPVLSLAGHLLKAHLGGGLDLRADVQGCGARSVHARFAPLPGSAAAAAGAPDIALEMRSEQAAPLWELGCSSAGGNLLMSTLGMDNIEATAECVRAGLKGEASSAATLGCLLGVWKSKLDLLFSLVMRVDAMRPEGTPDLLALLWGQLLAVDETIIAQAPESRAADADTLHACMGARTPSTPVSETWACLLAATGPAIDATYPTLLDLRSVFLTPALAALADELVAGEASTLAPDVLARVNAVLARDARPIQETVDAVLEVVRDLVAVVGGESPGAERDVALVATLHRLVPVLWSALQAVGIRVDGAPIGAEYDIADLDALEARSKADLIGGKAVEWTLTAMDADLVGTYTKSSVGYVLHPPPAVQAEVSLDALFGAAGSLAELAPLQQGARSAGTLRAGYRADADGLTLMAEADWRAALLKALEVLELPTLVAAVDSLPGWVDAFVAEWAGGHFWGSLNLQIDGQKVLAGLPLAFDEILDAGLTKDHIAPDGSWSF